MSKFGKVGIAVVVAASLALTACGGSKGSGGKSTANNKQTASATTNDIAPMDYASVPSGGTLRFPIDSFPPNYNINEIDGNDLNISNIMNATLPEVWNFDAGGNPILNSDVVDKAEQTSASPQTIHYHINTKAVWSDGSAITWKDFQGMFNALNGVNTAYQIASSNGYANMESVKQGDTANDVIVTFKANSPYPDWKSLFSPIMPAALDATPAAFNKSWVNGPTVAGGPFKVSAIDKTAKTVTLVHNDKWFGRAPKLDKIQYITIDQSAQAKALQSDQIDFVDIGSDVGTFATVKATPGVTIHKAGGPNWRHIDFGNSGAMSDLKVRQAVELSIDRVGDAKTLLGPLDWPATVLNSHIWMNNQAQYKSTCGDFCNRDIAKADSLLESAGYTKGSDGIYAKAGKPLNLSFVIPDGVKASSDEAALQTKALSEAGIKVTIKSVPSDPFFPDYVLKGAFDITIFSWIGTQFPISSAQSIYMSNGEQNYAKIGTKQLDADYTKVVSDLDSNDALQLSYKIDQQIWEEAHSVALYQRPDLVGTKNNLVNFGSFGFANTDYTDIGFKS